MTYRARGRSIFELVIVSYFSFTNWLYFIYVSKWWCNCIYDGDIMHLSTWLSSSFTSSSCFTFNFQALAFTAFLIGFITVLCIGNYFRAKRAQERQKQRRLTKQATQQAQYNNGSQPLPSGSFSSPRSTATTPHGPVASHDQESAFSAAETGGAYEAPKMPINSAVRA